MTEEPIGSDSSGKVYTVKIKYKGSVALERYDSYLTGIVGESGTAQTTGDEAAKKAAAQARAAEPLNFYRIR